MITSYSLHNTMVTLNIYESARFFGILLFTFMLGCFTTLFFFIHLFQKYLNFSSATHKSKDHFKSVEVGGLLRNNLNFSSINQTVESCRFINTLFAFVFKEWRDTAQLHKWVLKKVNIEIDELLETKAARRLVQRIKVNDFKLGTSVPVIHGAVLKEPFASTGNAVPDLVVVDADVEYDGGFWISVDVDLVFGKSAFVSVCVKHLKGKVRLQLNRQPCTHWSISFAEEPTINIKIDTSFQSRPLPQLGGLILNQIHRTIRRKHTFPHHKPRYTPINAYWGNPGNPPFGKEHSIGLSRIDVTIESCTRLFLPCHDKTQLPKGAVFATLSLDSASCQKLVPAKTEDEALPLLEPDPKATVNGEKVGTVQGRGKTKLVQDQMGSDGVNSREVNAASKEQPPTPKGPGTAYMMVTRSFTALLSEKHGCSLNKKNQVFVEVGSITWNKSTNDRPSITEGDRIVSINGHSIRSLSQAITVIKKIRTEKVRFYFKVQRTRHSTTPPTKRKVTKLTHKRAKRGPDFTLSRSPPPLPDLAASDEDAYAVSSGTEQETESDFSDIDSNDDLLFSSESTHSLAQLESVDDQSLVLPQASSSSLAATFDPTNSTVMDGDDKLSFAMLDASRPTAIVRTSLSSSLLSDHCWSDETLSLDVRPEHKFLNVRFWFQEVVSSRSKRGAFSSVASLSIPLFVVEERCSETGSQKFVQRHQLSNPQHHPFRSNFAGALKQPNGLKAYFGDATLTVKVHTR